MECLLRTSYLFQLGLEARWKFQILLHVYIEQFLKWFFLFHAVCQKLFIYFFQ